MGFPESKIKEAILHPVQDIRERAVHYFADTPCEDELVMPLIIEAVEKYGRAKGLDLLEAAVRLPQTDATLAWIICELGRTSDLSDVAHENHCLALGGILCASPPPLLNKHCSEILTAASFPEQLREPFSKRLDKFTWKWDRAWKALKYFGQDTLRRDSWSCEDWDWAEGIIEALARHRKKKADTVMALLRGQYGDEDETLMKWLRPCFVGLAGEMRLEEAIPLLLDGVDDEVMSEYVHVALPQIGGDAVVREIDARWWLPQSAQKYGFRTFVAIFFELIRGDLCIERCLEYFRTEEDQETKIYLADALLGNFSEEGVELVCEFLADTDDGDYTIERRNLRYRLVAVCMIMGRTFPQLEEWHKAALRDNWGRFDYKPRPMAEAFKPNQFGPKWSEN